MQHVHGWHLSYQPKEEFSYFAHRLRNFGTKHKDKKDLHAYLQKLRKHYTGEELMQDFDLAVNDIGLGDDQPIEDEVMQAAE